MGRDKVRYFVVKRNRNGSVRCYWQPSMELEALGWRLRRLPENPDAFGGDASAMIAAARAEAVQLNAKLDGWYDARARGEVAAKPDMSRPARGSVASLIHAYKASAFYRLRRPGESDGLTANTRKMYAGPLDYLERWLGPAPVRSVFAKDLRDRYDALRKRTPAAAHSLMRVGRLVFGKAHLLFRPSDPEYVAPQANPFEKLRLVGGENRAVMYSRAAIEWLVAAADLIERPSIGDAIELSYWFGQNSADVIELPSNLLERSPLKINRNKTGAACFLAVHRVPVLVARIEAGRERRKNLDVEPTTWIYSEITGRAYRRDNFSHSVARIREFAVTLARIAGDTIIADEIGDFEFAKLRHTSITAGAGLGLTEIEIQTFTGHSLKTIRAVLERHYLAPNKAAAVAAIDKRVKGEAR